MLTQHIITYALHQAEVKFNSKPKEIKSTLECSFSKPKLAMNTRICLVILKKSAKVSINKQESKHRGVLQMAVIIELKITRKYLFTRSRKNRP